MFSKFLSNKVIRIMVLVELFSSTAFGVFSPVFAIFIVDSIQGGSAKVAGFAAAILLVVKGIAQLPIARFLDKTGGEQDDFWAYFIGQVLFGIAVLLYLAASTPTHIYLIQALMGIALAFNTPPVYGIFTRHVDKNYESFEWSMYSVFSYSFATAIAGAAGGLIVAAFGFNALFLVAGFFFIVSACVTLLFLKKHIVQKRIVDVSRGPVVMPPQGNHRKP